MIKAHTLFVHVHYQVYSQLHSCTSDSLIVYFVSNAFNRLGLDDSGVSTLLLESPCGMELSPPTSLEALSQLEMYPISPDKNR